MQNIRGSELPEVLKRPLEGRRLLKLAFHRALACFKRNKDNGKMTILVAKGPTALVKVVSLIYSFIFL
jgi:hypothetical protein